METTLGNDEIIKNLKFTWRRSEPITCPDCGTIWDHKSIWCSHCKDKLIGYIKGPRGTSNDRPMLDPSRDFQIIFQLYEPFAKDLLLGASGNNLGNLRESPLLAGDILFFVSDCYYFGIGTQIDSWKAREYRELAAQFGNNEANTIIFLENLASGGNLRADQYLEQWLKSIYRNFGGTKELDVKQNGYVWFREMYDSLPSKDIDCMYELSLLKDNIRNVAMYCDVYGIGKKASALNAAKRFENSFKKWSLSDPFVVMWLTGLVCQNKLNFSDLGEYFSDTCNDDYDLPSSDGTYAFRWMSFVGYRRISVIVGACLGRTDCQLSLGYSYGESLYEESPYDPDNYEKMKLFPVHTEEDKYRWFQHAYSEGEMSAARNLYYLTCSSDSIYYNLDMAEKYASIEVDYDKSAAASLYHSLAAHFRLAHNYNKAFYYTQLAVQSGSNEDKKDMFECYLKGEGVQADLEKALFWLTSIEGNNSTLDYIKEIGNGDIQTGLRRYKDELTSNVSYRTKKKQADDGAIIALVFAIAGLIICCGGLPCVAGIIAMIIGFGCYKDTSHKVLAITAGILGLVDFFWGLMVLCYQVIESL